MSIRSPRPNEHVGPLRSGPFARQVVDTLSDAVYIVDPEDARILDANRAASEMTGYPLDRLQRMRVHDINPSMDAEEAWEQFTWEVNRDGRFTWTGEHRRQDGGLVPVEVTIESVEGDEGVVYIAVVRDITDRLAAWEAQEAMAHDVRERVKELGLLHSLANLLHANKDPLDVLFPAILDRIPPAWQYPSVTEARITYGDRTFATPSFHKCIASQRATLDTLDGTAGAIEVGYTEDRPPADEGPFLAEEDSLLDSMAAMLQNHLDDRLRARETALQARMLEEIGQAVIATDPKGTVEFWNRAAEELYGYTAEEAIGADIGDLTVPDTTRQQAGEIMAALQRGEAWTGEFSVRDKAGREFPAMVTDAPIHDGDGELVGIIGISQDITEERRAEALREEAILHRAEAEHFEKVASFKTQFLNTAAHELSTPITPLRFQIQGLRSGMFGDLTEQQEEALSVIERNVLRFGRLTQDLLDAARLQAGHLKLQPEQVDVSCLVEETAGGFRGLAADEGVALTLDVEPGLTIAADPDRLGQVVTNLVDNALKFTPAGGHVSVRLQASDQGATLIVKDDGLGMGETQLSELFQPFTQLHEPDTNHRRGTGLGLYVTEGIVAQHGGTLEAESPGPGKGTTFTVKLPGRPPGRDQGC